MTAPYIKWREIFFVSLAVIILNLVSYYGLKSVAIFIFMMGVLLLVVNKRQGIYFFICAFLAYSDIPFTVSDDAGMSTIFTEKIGFFSISVIWTLIIFIVLAFKYLATAKISKRPIVAIYLFLIYVILGLQYIGMPGGRWVSDFAYFINIFTGILIAWYLSISVYSYDTSKLGRHLGILITVFASKCMFLVLHALYVGGKVDLFNYLSESGMYLSAFFIPLIIAALYSRVHYVPKNFMPIAIFLIILVNVTSSSRGRLIIILLAASIALVKLGRIRDILKYAPLFALPVAFLPLLNENYFTFLLWKAGSFNVGEAGSESSTVRYIEFLNILYMHLERGYSLFIGTGIGGYFTSEYFDFTFQLYDTNSYPDLWISNDTFFKPHGSSLYIFLKFGIIGLLYCFLYIPWMILSVVRRNYFEVNSSHYPVLIACLCSIFPMFLTNFSSKLQLFTGLILGIALACQNHQVKQRF